MRSIDKKVVTIGGGSGTPAVNEALLFAGVKSITSVITVMDSGGITGRMRTDSRGQEVAYSDSLRTLLSLIPPAQKNRQKAKVLREILRRRSRWSQDLGYTIFSHFFSSDTGFAPVQEVLEKLTGVKFAGRVLPVTTQSAELVFATKLGQKYRGEHELDDKRMSGDMVDEIWLEPQVNGFPKAIEAIIDADYIIFACGSFYGSIIVNLLPTGIKEALKISKAPKILVTNAVSSRVETHGFTPANFMAVFERYSKVPKLLDLILIPELTRSQFEKKYPDVAHRYALDNSYFLGWEEKDLKNVSILKHRAVVIDPVLGRVRHDPKKLAFTFRQLLK